MILVGYMLCCGEAASVGRVVSAHTTVCLFVSFQNHGMASDPMLVARGALQRLVQGPPLYNITFGDALHPVHCWCMGQRLGVELLDGSTFPFVAFVDNIFILATLHLKAYEI